MSRKKAEEILKQEIKAAISVVVVVQVNMEDKSMKDEVKKIGVMKDVVGIGNTILLIKIKSLVTRGFRNTKYSSVIFLSFCCHCMCRQSIWS